MSRSSFVPTALGLAILAGSSPPAAAQPPSKPPDMVTDTVVVTARKPAHTSEVTVTATNWCPDPDPAHYRANRAPQVVDSYPKADGVVAPGLALVRVTFDAPMSCFSEVTVIAEGADPCQPAGTWSLPARRSWVMVCRLAPATAYTLRFRKSEGAGFVGLSGRTAEPYELSFTTSEAAPTPTLEAARRADPGPPDEFGRTSAYVTCADMKGAVRGSDCAHERLKRPD